MLAMAEQMRDAIMRAPDKARGTATIGLPPSLSTIFTLTLVDECRRVFSDVTLHLMEGLSIFLEEWPSVGRIDMAVLTNSGDAPLLSRSRLAREELVLIGGSGLVDAIEAPISVREIASIELVIT